MPDPIAKPLLEAPGHSRLVRWSLFGLGLLLLTYTVVRAVTVSFSWDETWTFLRHVLRGIFYQRTYDQMGANHHLLNVWGMWLSWKLFGDGTLALRLPNLLAHAIYLYASGRIALKARSGFLAIAVFVLLNVHPYLLDFFSLARGYGLACGWMMLALWHVWRYFDEGYRPKEVLWVAVCGSLAAMSHLIMIDLLLALGLAFLVIWSLQARRMGPAQWKRSLLLLCVPSLVGLGLILPEAFGLLHGGSLYYGSDSLWPGTAISLGEMALYYQYYQPYGTSVLALVSVALVTVALVCLASMAAAMRGGWLQRLMPMFFGMLILLGCILSFFLEHLLFQVPFPATRTALFLLPLLAFILATALLAWPRPSWPVSLTAAILCIPLLIHQYNSFNLKYALEWKASGELAHMLKIIATDQLPLTDERPVVTVCAGSLSHASIPYYQYLWHMHWLVASERDPDRPFVPSDYYIVEYNGYDGVDTANWELLYRSEATNTNLYRDKRMHNSPPTVIFHAEHDMEDISLPGSSTDHAVSGKRSILFTTQVRSAEPISWTVGPDQARIPTEFVGSCMVLQPDDSDWISVVFRLMRAGREVGHADVSSALQMDHFGEWNRVGLIFRPSVPLEAGDSIQLLALPYTDDTPLYLDDLQMTVLH